MRGDVVPHPRDPETGCHVDVGRDARDRRGHVLALGRPESRADGEVGEGDARRLGGRADAVEAVGIPPDAGDRRVGVVGQDRELEVLRIARGDPVDDVEDVHGAGAQALMEAVGAHAQRDVGAHPDPFKSTCVNEL
ncbi:hypothetical protein GCM10025881_10390 [Pseudolysinimonas kribbensis]|uniref:Uncharacterized protein n=1 Tax=Pseudolysinimonas kribbensis TaxID=433641 RepID=A0ABQ6K0T4_9MICO|nr:hypothetical protein GCM10025881_10390 [Pseudolysinimonas kribbensis]